MWSSLPTITLPANSWRPRIYQRRLWSYLESGGKRAVAVWHRRSGKDEVALNWASTAMVERPATYWHMLPEAAQARKAIWEAVNPHTGKRRIDEAFPRDVFDTRRENEMLIRARTGATWQVVGSDNYNSLVGSPPLGVVFSEWALADPAVWAYVRPILAENGGWALFIYTPRGGNHGKRTFDAANSEPTWFAERLTVDQTKVIAPEILAQERIEYERDFGPEDGKSLFEQEYYCSFSASNVGSYYASLIERVEKDNRITNVPYDPAVPVYTAWDLGIGDSTAIWFMQLVGKEVHAIDYLENSGAGMDWYVGELRARGYSYGEHILPHDAQAKEFIAGKTREEHLRSLGFSNLKVLPRASVSDGINAARKLLPRVWFDAKRCSRGIECLREYHREWDDKRKVFHDRPFHDWSSHGADAFRYAALGLPEAQKPWGGKLDYSQLDKMIV